MSRSLLWGEMQSLVHTSSADCSALHTLPLSRLRCSPRSGWSKLTSLTSSWVSSSLICGSRCHAHHCHAVFKQTPCHGLPSIDWSDDNFSVWDVSSDFSSSQDGTMQNRTGAALCCVLQQVENTSRYLSNLLKSLHWQRLQNLLFQGLTLLPLESSS